ncbi:hypothetical protein [Nocardia mexicana]|uniref:Mce-associated membrane protein n=1 Tax=Nocardia mexicana TaxID=279262 RepID=A0A370GTL6_9NOCA|nr:hypothetical protein [Nocardia mexicana]RDI45263.1 Mce-associated membrane protein [Nocardia mexicana]
MGDPDSTGDPGETANEPAAQPMRRRLRIVAPTVAGVIGIAGAAAGTYFYVQHEHVRDLENARAAAQRAACEYGPVIANYDAGDLDSYFAGVLRGATGDWRKEFDATSKDLREVLRQGQVVSKVSTVQCAIEKADAHTARAVVVIGQTITSVGTGNQPRPGQLSITVSLEQNASGVWLVNKVDSPVLPQS